MAEQEWLQAFRSVLAAERDLTPIPTTSPSPLSLSDPECVRSLLTSGFADVRLTSLAEPMYYGADVDHAFRFVAAQQAGMVRGLLDEVRTRALDALRADLAAHETAAGCSATRRRGSWRRGARDRGRAGSGARAPPGCLRGQAPLDARMSTGTIEGGVASRSPAICPRAAAT